MTPEERFAQLLGEADGVVEIGKRTARGGAIAMLAEVVEFVLRLGSLAILARLLVPEHFGLLSMVMAITAIADRFKDLGLALVTIQRVQISHRQVSTMFWLNTLLGVAIFVLFAACGPLIAAFYRDERLVEITVALAVSFVWGGATIQHQALLRRKLAFRTLASVQISASILSVVVAIVLATLGFGYWALVARELARSIFLAFGTWYALPWTPGRPRWDSDMKPMLAFGGDITLFNLVWFLAHNLDQILVGRLFGPTALGLYRQGINLVLAPVSQLYFPVNSIAESTLSRVHGDREKYRHYYVRLVGIASSMLMPVVALLAVLAEDVVVIALGSKWNDAAEFVRILAVAAFIKPATTTAGFVMTTCGMSRRYLWWGMLTSLSIVTCFLVGARWGASGIAWGHVAATYICLLPLLKFGFEGTPIRLSDFAIATVRPVLASLIMAVIVAWFRLQVAALGALSTLALSVLIAVPTYAVLWVVLPGGRAAVRELFGHLRAITGQLR